jgi:hypothetical protein
MADIPDPLIDDVLDLLDGWVISDPGEGEEPTEPETPTDDGEVHTVTTVEVNKFIVKAKRRAAGHIELENVEKLPSTELVDEAVATWAAGLLWNKYVVKVTEGKEDQDPTTYGDKKIAEAKAMLKPVNTDEDDDDSQGESAITVFSINSETLKEEE